MSTPKMPAPVLALRELLRHAVGMSGLGAGSRNHYFVTFAQVTDGERGQGAGRHARVMFRP